MTSPAPDTTDPQPSTSDPSEPKFRVGDQLKIPCHGGVYVAEVVHIYDSLDDAMERYPKSYRTILQTPFKKPKPDQFYYYCEVNNTTRKPVGVAESNAELKWRPDDAADAFEA